MDTAPAEIYTLSLHDALPILGGAAAGEVASRMAADRIASDLGGAEFANSTPDQIANSADRKSTRLNSSHANISYAVFCLKKKKKKKNTTKTKTQHNHPQHGK